MKKKETITNIFEHCGECPHAGMPNVGFRTADYKYKCDKTRRIIKDLWGEIPSFCPLEDAE